jgi:hypothetical protein
MTLRERYQAWRVRRACRRVRREAALLGYDLSALRDEDLIEGLRRLARVLAASGVSAEALQRGLTQALRKEG